MKNTFPASLVLLFFLFQDIRVSAQWTASEGMDGAIFNDMVIMDSTLFAATGTNGLYSRNIYGGQWEQKFPNRNFNQIMNAGSALFAMQSWDTCYVSMDKGNSWNIAPFTEEWFQTIALDTSLFAVIENHICRSDDYGQTFHPIFTIPGFNYGWLHGNDHALFLAGGNYTQFLYSLDYGVTWDSIPSLYGGGGLLDIYYFNNQIWGAELFPRIRRWDPIMQGWTVVDTVSITKFGTFNNSLIGGGRRGFYKYDSVANHFDFMNTQVEPSHVSNLCSTDSLLFCSTPTNIYKTGTDFSWEKYDDGLHQAKVSNVSTIGDEVWAITNLGIFKSTDFGTHFEKQEITGPSEPQVIVLTDSVFYMLSNDGFSISRDHGISWINENNGLPLDSINYGFRPLTNVQGDPNYLFLATMVGLYRSAYSPIHWHRLNYDSSMMFGSVVCYDSVLLVSIPQYINISRSTDEGITFKNSAQSKNLIKTDDYVYAINWEKVKRSDNTGLSWQIFPVPVSQGWVSGLTQSGMAVTVGGTTYDNNYIYNNFLSVTFDDGYSWTDIRENLPFFFGHRIGLGPIVSHGERILTALEERGMWYNDYALTGQYEIIPQKNQILKISPNPAFDKIIVTIDIEKDESGKLRIIDITGRTVYDSGIKEYLRGAYRTSIDIQNLNDGLYIISYNTSGKSIHGKFIKTSW